MTKLLKILSLLVILFIAVSTWVFIKIGGEINSVEYLSVVLPTIGIFSIVFLLLLLMGKAPGGKEFVSAHDTVAIYREGKRRIIWISAAWGVDSGRLFVTTFSKERSIKSLEDIQKIMVENAQITVLMNHEKWVITTDNHEQKAEKIEKLMDE